MSVIYEVALEIDAAVAAAYRAWLDGHIREILALPGFLDATLYALDDPPPAAGRLALCVQYRLRDADALAAYCASMRRACGPRVWPASAVASRPGGG